MTIVLQHIVFHMEVIKSTQRLESTTAELPPADGHCFGKWEYKYSRKKSIFISAISFLLIYLSKVYKWTSVPVTPLQEQFNTPHKEMTVEEVLLSLSWAPSTSSFTCFTNSSSAQHSVARLEHPRARYCVGDTLSVLLEMRNYAGHPKAYGGDFMLARIHSPNLHACASGDITDFFNGSYRVRFRLSWPGEVQVSVRLVHSSEAVKLLQRDWMQDYNKAMHVGTFIQGGKREPSQCALRLNSSRPLCEYRKKEDGEYYACYRPQTLPCNSLTIMKSYMAPGPHLTSEEARLLARENTGIEIRNRFKPVTALRCTGVAHRPTRKCVAGLNSPFPGGYFNSNEWSSSYCQTGPFLSEDAITRCLKGKTLYILGDSTMYQWIDYLERKLKGLRFIIKGEHSWLGVDAQNNITVHWALHFHPWIGSNQFNIKTAVTIPQVLDSISVGGGQQDVIVAIGVGQHFRAYPPEVFIRRLLSIRRAILRLYARNPRANIVIKLENSRELGSMAAFSNWYGHMQNQAQRKVFEDMNVALVDAWDMTVAASTFAIHPKGFIVPNEVAMALSFFCH